MDLDLCSIYNQNLISRLTKEYFYQDTLFQWPHIGLVGRFGSALASEAWVIRQAIFLAEASGVAEDIFESDSSIVVNAIH